MNRSNDAKSGSTGKTKRPESANRFLGQTADCFGSARSRCRGRGHVPGKAERPGEFSCGCLFECGVA